MIRTLPVLSVEPSRIKEERDRFRWSNFHPEAFCHRCGTRNLCWFTPNEYWNSIRSRISSVAPSEIICPQCFTEMWEEAHPEEHPVWEVRVDHPERASLPLIEQIEILLDTNPHASTAFLAARIAMLVKETP